MGKRTNHLKIIIPHSLLQKIKGRAGNASMLILKNSMESAFILAGFEVCSDIVVVLLLRNLSAGESERTFHFAPAIYRFTVESDSLPNPSKPSISKTMNSTTASNSVNSSQPSTPPKKHQRQWAPPPAPLKRAVRRIQLDHASLAANPDNCPEWPRCNLFRTEKASPLRYSNMNSVFPPLLLENN